MATVINYRQSILLGTLDRILDTTTIITGAGSFIKATPTSDLDPVSITLTGTASGFGSHTPTYQWYYISSLGGNWVTISGATASTLVIPSATFETHKSTGSYVTYRLISSFVGYNSSEDTHAIQYQVYGDIGNPGAAGENGSRYAQVYLDQWSDTVPTTFPVGDSVYTWATASFTNPATLNGWSKTPGASTPGYSLYRVIVPYSDKLVTTSTSITWPATPTMYVIGVAGAVGPAGDIGPQGPVGPTGNKVATISCFKWSNSGIGIYAQAFTYTWASKDISAYPAGWDGSAAAAPGSGYTLYQLNMVVTDVFDAILTNLNWNNATTGSIGYRQDGTIGPKGDSARVAYIVTTSGTAPITPTAGIGDVAPLGGWSFTATSNLSDGQYMYQSDGTMGASNIVWGAPYLSNLKVGSLSALSANLGSVTISTNGSLSSSGKSYGSGNGVFLGYNGGAYKLDVGSTSSYLRWDGTTLEATGIVIKNSSGQTILSTNLTSADLLNSSIVLNSNGTLSGGGGGSVTLNGIGFTGDTNATYGATSAQVTSIITAQTTANTAITNAATAQTAANNAASAASTAQTAANTANSALTNLASDNILSPLEKPSVVQDYNVIVGEQAGIDAQANVYGITTEKTSYDNAVIALSSYLSTLSGWNTIPGSDVTIVGTTFRTKFSDVYTTRQALLNKITDNAKIIADSAASAASAAQGTANTAVTNASTAQGTANTAVTNAATAQSTANTALSTANSATTALGTKLSLAGSQILTGPVSLNAATAILVGNTNDGLYLGSTGIVGRKAGITTFSVDQAGNAIFGGSLNAATGTFAGNLSAAGGTFSGNLSAAGGTFSGSLSAAGGTFSGTLSAASGSFVGAVNVGSFTGYAWPSAGQYGAHLSANGLLIGNANNGTYFQVTDLGNVYAPGFKVENGTLTISQLNVIGTGNIVNNAVTNRGGLSISGYHPVTGSPVTLFSYNGYWAGHWDIPVGVLGNTATIDIDINIDMSAYGARYAGLLFSYWYTSGGGENLISFKEASFIDNPNDPTKIRALSIRALNIGVGDVVVRFRMMNTVASSILATVDVRATAYVK